MIEFKRLRASCRRAVLQAKKLCWEEYVSSIDHTTSTTKLWKKIRSTSGKSKFKCINLIKKGHECLTDPIDIVECLADHFEQASSNMNFNADEEEFLQTKIEKEQPLNFSTRDKLDYNDPFTIDELENALKDINNSSPGPDNITYIMLTKLPIHIKIGILNLYNKIWENGEYPLKWKEVIIIPIPKEAKDSSLPNNYRPISLSCCLSKVFEKMVNCRLTWLLETKRLLSNYQHGFRKSHSTLDPIMYLQNTIQMSFLTQAHTVAIFFDLEKAFDMTWRYNILKTLHVWGIRGNLPQLIQTFMTNRKFRVRIGDKESTTRHLENGIPQGSNLSVTLFAIAVNNLASNLNTSVEKCMYVDDLVIFSSGQNMQVIRRTLQHAINQVVCEAETRGFRFSEVKTTAIHFCRKRQIHRDPELFIKEIPIRYTNSKKFLGLIFDNKLTWREHITYVITRCKKALNVLKCVSNINWGANREVIIRLYLALVQSKIDYGSAAYSSASQSTLKSLNTILHCGLRCATGAFRTSPGASLCVEAGIPPLDLALHKNLLKYGARIWANPQHRNFKILFGNSDPMSLQSPRVKLPTVRLKMCQEIYNLSLPTVLSTGFCETPPWIMSVPKINYKLLEFNKKDTNEQLLRAHFHTILEEIDAIPIYTDGSKTDTGTGSAIHFRNESHSWTLPQSSGIFTAELYAIWQALLFVTASVHNKFVICSDSLTSLQAISDKFSSDSMIQRILALIHHISQSSKQVTFVWCPSHVGISGNEAADKAAYSATRNRVEDIPIRLQDCLTDIKEKMLESWQHQWNLTENKLKTVKTTVIRWSIPNTINRREAVTLTRLRIGHTKLTHAHLISKQVAPICATCHVPTTVKHILEECSQYTNVRRMVGLSNTLSLALSNDKQEMQKVINFCRMTGLIHQL